MIGKGAYWLTVQKIWNNNSKTRSTWNSERLCDEKALSLEDKTFMKIMEESVVHIDGHYHPFRDKSTKLPNNKMQAHVFAACLKKKHNYGERQHELNTDFMENLVNHGYIHHTTVLPNNWSLACGW